MTKKLLMGNAAAAHGALAAGVNLISGYPGTPSSELLEVASAFVQNAVADGVLSAEQAPHVEWSVNEKAALEVAYGASISGARALVTMKQVGLNVAADPFMTIATLGVKGGLVLYVADDPGPISSQNEQDTRLYAQFAKIPLLDSSSPEELFALMPRAFRLSEQHGCAVIVRATTRICHGSAPVPAVNRYKPHPISGFERNPRWVIFPPLAYQAHLAVPERLQSILANPDFSDLNYQIRADDTPAELGIVAGGISWSYLQDVLCQYNLSASFDLLKLGAPFPFPEELVTDFLMRHRTVLVFEELEPTIERELHRVAGSEQTGSFIYGKLTGTTRFAGENSVAIISDDLLHFLRVVGLLPKELLPEESLLEESLLEELATLTPEPSFDELLIPRPPVLCAGCPHRASFYAVKKALQGKKAFFSGDIGCYTLGNSLPLNMVDTCVCMGAGFTVPQGMHWAQPDALHLGFVGDSTFYASGLTGVVNAVYNQSAITFVVLDNELTAMTGSQPHPGTGLRMSYDAKADDVLRAPSIARVIEALGVRQVYEIDPLKLPQAIEAVTQATQLTEVSAVVFRAPCVNVGKRQAPPQLLSDDCTGCWICIDSIGCPALIMNDKAGLVHIDEEHCFGCDLCTQICPTNALESTNGS